MKRFSGLFTAVSAPEGLFAAWAEFRKGKGKKADVLLFERDLEQNIFQLHRDLRTRAYRHGAYTGFMVSDPKLRHIHKATVRDRVVHHAVFTALNRVFEPTFIADSFSCRVGKGTHKGVARVQQMIRQVSKNDTHACYALKCDVKKFFDTVDHAVLLNILRRRVDDPELLWLLEEIIESYCTGIPRERERESSNDGARKGVPIGNLTSQIFANIYMNEFDQFVKHELRVRHYARYTDDFMIIADSRGYLESLIPAIEEFLNMSLHLALHPDKILIQPCHRGVDFLGYVIFPHHRIIRARTRRRMFRKLRERVEEYNAGLRTEQSLRQVLQSYVGMLVHANAHTVTQKLKNHFWYWKSGSKSSP